jgi:hypothetical protein
MLTKVKEDALARERPIRYFFGSPLIFLLAGEPGIKLKRPFLISSDGPRGVRAVGSFKVVWLRLEALEGLHW